MQKVFTAAATATPTTTMTEATAVALGEVHTPPPSSYAAILSAYFCHCNAISDVAVAVADFHGQI